MQLHDNEQFTLTVQAADSKGVPLQDTITWSVDDEAVATLTVSADTQSATVVAGLPGSAVVTVSDGTVVFQSGGAEALVNAGQTGFSASVNVPPQIIPPPPTLPQVTPPPGFGANKPTILNGGNSNECVI